MRIVQMGGADRTETGEAIDLSDADIGLPTLRDAVRGETDASLAVECPSPSGWWESLAVPTDGTASLDRLVAAARSRGIRVPEERALATAQRKLADLSAERVDPAETRKRLAAAGAEVEQLREQVATARGRLNARREVDADTDAAEAALADAATRLSEAETERLAAEQAHEAAERRARRARSVRERRLRLQDRVANRRRDARRALVCEIADAFENAVEAVPGEAALSTAPLEIEGDDVTAAFAAVRVADIRAPVVDATGRFDSAKAAADVLDAAVIRC
ncbi:MAG: hypothetical protein ABEH90_04540 [Halolamina sp.]